MPHRFDLIDPLADGRWNSFIEANAPAMIFHHPSWLRVLRRQYGFVVRAAVFIDEERIVAGVPFCEVTSFGGARRWIALPFTDHCFPITERDEDTAALLTAIAASAVRERIAEIELRFPGLQKTFHAGEQSYFHQIPLTNADDVFRRFKKTRVQQAITKALKEGQRGSIETSASAVESFYRLHLLTRRKLGVPIQPRRFFDVVHEEMIANGLGFIALVSSGDAVIGAGLFLRYRGTCVYKYGASDPAKLSLKPNNVMLWTAIQEAIRLQCTTFDMGKTDHANEGLRAFKNGWGAEESILWSLHYPAAPQRGSLAAIRERIVAPLIRYTPSFVCRVIGEMAYKYFPSA